MGGESNIIEGCETIEGGSAQSAAQGQIGLEDAAKIFGKRSEGGEFFEGQFENGKRKGYGLYRTRDYEYKGNWENGMMNGIGELAWFDGKKYDGNFRDNKFEG